VHTSTITVAVLTVPKATAVHIRTEDLEYKMTRGSGAGGQHRNVTDSAVQLVHLPTGTQVRCESERSQYQNKAVALEMLRSKLHGAAQAAYGAARAAKRRGQLGTGMRGDKRRTVALQRGTVNDHKMGRMVRAKAYLRGDLSALYTD